MDELKWDKKSTLIFIRDIYNRYFIHVPDFHLFFRKAKTKFSKFKNRLPEKQFITNDFNNFFYMVLVHALYWYSSQLYIWIFVKEYAGRLFLFSRCSCRLHSPESLMYNLRIELFIWNNNYCFFMNCLQFYNHLLSYMYFISIYKSMFYFLFLIIRMVAIKKSFVVLSHQVKEMTKLDHKLSSFQSCHLPCFLKSHSKERQPSSQEEEQGLEKGWPPCCHN